VVADNPDFRSFAPRPPRWSPLSGRLFSFFFALFAFSMPYLFTSESVSEGHPDKVADQISDAILDEYLRQDPTAKVACETLVTTDFALVAGEIKSTAHVDA
jgi:hypothetical protein